MDTDDQQHPKTERHRHGQPGGVTGRRLHVDKGRMREMRHGLRHTPEHENGADTRREQHGEPGERAVLRRLMIRAEPDVPVSRQGDPDKKAEQTRDAEDVEPAEVRDGDAGEHAEKLGELAGKRYREGDEQHREQSGNEENLRNGVQPQALELLAQADELDRIVNLVGPEALSAQQRWVLEMARIIREGLLQQSAIDDVDSYASAPRQFQLLKLMHETWKQGESLLSSGVPVQVLLEIPELTRVVRAKSLYGNDEIDAIHELEIAVRSAFRAIHGEYQQVEKLG